MAKVKIENLPKETKISRQEMRAVIGGRYYTPSTRMPKPSWAPPALGGLVAILAVTDAGSDDDRESISP